MYRIFIFLQNFACEFDVQNHLLPFISELEQLDKDTEVNQIIIDLYFDKKSRACSCREE